ncbi:MAG: PEP-CTERM sorting domain-containing protein [Fimbriimonadaceae bacterium]|nr:MAG: hypothetical protein UZ18_ATM001000217 [Armatimonadetes bacterium OLB18]WKZ81473.1 MAG: PEP-CTERM sorting domain-containing protein [Fimbriimonadaceae bacterium]
MISSKWPLKGLAFAAMASFSALGSALTIDFYSTNVLTGPGIAAGVPVLSVTITDSAPDEVSVTVFNNAPSGTTQTVKTLWLNVDPYPASLRGGSGDSHVDSINWGATADTQGAPMGLTFDVKIEFKTGGPTRIPAQDSSVFTLTGSGLDESDFFTGTPQDADILGVAHVISTVGNEESVHLYAVPEPASIAGMLLGFGAIAARRARKKNSA